MTPPTLDHYLKASALRRARTRAPGYVAALVQLASSITPDRVLVTREAMAELRSRFPEVNREYGEADATSDAQAWVPPPTRTFDPTPVTPTPSPAQAPVPRDQWPLTVKLLATQARQSDRGVGDIVARLASLAGGESMKAWYKRLTGSDCGCADRQARLNQRYPFTD